MRRGRLGGSSRMSGAPASAGFTLIEILVVMVVIACMAGLAVVSAGVAGPARELTHEADRLAGLIGVLADEAVLDNREYGLRVERDRYQVFYYDEASRFTVTDGRNGGRSLKIENADQAKAAFVVPPRPLRSGTIHVILAVTDKGAPPLTRYRRVIVDVAP